MYGISWLGKRRIYHNPCMYMGDGMSSGCTLYVFTRSWWPPSIRQYISFILYILHYILCWVMLVDIVSRLSHPKTRFKWNRRLHNTCAELSRPRYGRKWICNAINGFCVGYIKSALGRCEYVCLKRRQTKVKGRGEWVHTIKIMQMSQQHIHNTTCVVHICMNWYKHILFDSKFTFLSQLSFASKINRFPDAYALRHGWWVACENLIGTAFFVYTVVGLVWLGCPWDRAYLAINAFGVGLIYWWYIFIHLMFFCI